ncbi:MAG: EF-Tu/IF-2/RF-3 family GTPase, partial [Myxococcota bacterium]
MDRDGASASRVLAELRSTLNLNAALVQMPFGSGAGFAGVIDLIEMKAVRNEGEHGERVREDVVPSGLLDEAKELRAQLVETLADEHDGVLEALVEGRSVAAELLHQAIRESVLRRSFVPVLVGSAMKNTGVQPLLDAIVRYLPSPLEAEPQCAVAGDSESALELSADSEKPVVALAFKSVEDDHGALTYLRVYQGTLEKGQVVVNTTTGERLKVGRLVRMHADEKTEVRSATAGDIVALVGGRAASGDTLASPELSRLTLESLEVPNCVISLALSPADHESADRMARVLARFSREDPTLRVSSDPESGQTLISGMGELYLEVAIEKMRRDHGVELRVGQPRVSFREAIKRRAEFSYLLRKQTGGSGQFARVVGYVEPLDEFSGF